MIKTNFVFNIIIMYNGRIIQQPYWLIEKQIINTEVYSKRILII